MREYAVLNSPGNPSAARPGSKWAARFIGAAMVQGAAAFAAVGVLLYLTLFGQPSAARVVAAGGAGTWLFVGVVALALGILATGLSALFYHHIEVVLGAPYRGWRNGAAWAHLLLGGAGGVAASLVTAYGGYYAGGALLPTQFGGGGHDVAWVHVNVLAPLVLPIAALSAVTMLGFFLGGAGYVTAWWKARRGP